MSLCTLGVPSDSKYHLGQPSQGYFFPTIMVGKRKFQSFFPTIIRDPGGKKQGFFPTIFETLVGKSRVFPTLWWEKRSPQTENLEDLGIRNAKFPLQKLFYHLKYLKIFACGGLFSCVFSFTKCIPEAEILKISACGGLLSH